ncbi:MAG: biotin--[acetyl-CoA-carboxylase] ligase [Winogradskyella sp.]|nr:biotin--[acetyl-CoA-carboxylase] ligase [Winogradskyella sp.]
MYIIKLDAIDSTNTYLKTLCSVKLPNDFTVVSSDSQTLGRGQMGTHWQTERGKNLIVSVFKKHSKFHIEEQFYVSMVVALAIYQALKTFNLPQLCIKWPNDILSAKRKICGILIENIVKSNKLQGSVIGFGLNVNQKYFKDLPQASSMSLLTGILFQKEEVLSEILKQLEIHFEMLASQKFTEIKSQYENLLFRKDKPSTFKRNDAGTFSGIIKGVTRKGKLKIWMEDEIVETFDLKEVALLY